MKKYITILLLCVIRLTANSQNNADSLHRSLRAATTDSVRYIVSRGLYNFFEEKNRDSALYYAEQCASLAHKNGKPLNEAFCMDIRGYQLLHLGNYAASLESILQAYKIIDEVKGENDESWSLSIYPSPGKSKQLVKALSEHMYAILMEQTQNVSQQIFHFNEARTISLEIDNKYRLLLADMNLGSSYALIGKADSALLFASEAEKISREANLNKYRGAIYCILGDVYFMKGNKQEALKNFYEGMQWARNEVSNSGIIMSLSRLLNYYQQAGQKDSVLKYALQHLEAVRAMGAITSFRNNIGIAYEGLATAYELRNQFDSSFKYRGLALTTKDSLYKLRIQNLAAFQNASFAEQRKFQEMQQQEYKDEQTRKRRSQWRVIASLGLLILVFILVMYMQWRNSRLRKKANLLLQEQKEKLENALRELKATQSQLIQSEKMASLGELTAGIAHEIQNPLNFVNNFSEVNKELTDELDQAIGKGNYAEAREITKDIKANEEKINHHGKRADAIVKGMLQHSRSRSGIKEPADINALADEYLRLAYHGLRAKDKSFNATMKTAFDKSIEMVNVVPQDIGRVILNLITNAFYAVNEKAKQGVAGYVPTVTVSTQQERGMILIQVRDNGTGIPQAVLDKIFQPFFTTKPTGQGTGLGLSLSYDIIKAHGGKLEVETKEGEGSMFIIGLPN